MAPRKTERILNLTIALLSTRRFLTREQIRDAVEGYQGLTDAAFQRTFERDKDELRELGVPIETGSHDAYFDDAPGYRISRSDFQLPPVEFTPQEATVLSLAGEVWRSAALAESSTSALAKLRAAGVEPETSRVTAVAPTMVTREPAFPGIWDAWLSRTRVRFGYRTADSMRTLEPWRLLSRRGAWYVLGLDLDRDEPRMYKLSRIAGPVEQVGQPGAYQPPDAGVLAGWTTSLEPPDPIGQARLAIRGEQAPVLRRRGRPVAGEAPAGYALYEVGYARTDELVGEVCAAGADVLVLDPPEIRAAVLDRLRHVAGTAGGAR